MDTDVLLSFHYFNSTIVHYSLPYFFLPSKSV